MTKIVYFGGVFVKNVYGNPIFKQSVTEIRRKTSFKFFFFKSLSFPKTISEKDPIIILFFITVTISQSHKALLILS